MALIAVGRLKAGPERDLFERYFKRAGALARTLGLGGVDIREVAQSRAARASDRQAEEARGILAALPKDARLTLLDERGEALSSERFADDIARARETGVGAYAIVIGGADGLDPTLRDDAHRAVSFGAMTWPHQFARVMAAEQLYRALSIIAGHPYHRG